MEICISCENALFPGLFGAQPPICACVGERSIEDDEDDDDDFEFIDLN